MAWLSRAVEVAEERKAARAPARVTEEDEERLDWYLSSYQAEGA